MPQLSSRAPSCVSPGFSCQTFAPEDEWMRLHLSLGVCGRRAWAWFQNAEPALRERYQLALVLQVSPATLGHYPLLHDPLEDDPRWTEAFEEADEILAFELELAGIECVRPCALLWSEKARILREEFDLQWFSPAQMNPLVAFA